MPSPADEGGEGPGWGTGGDIRGHGALTHDDGRCERSRACVWGDKPGTNSHCWRGRGGLWKKMAQKAVAVTKSNCSPEEFCGGPVGEGMGMGGRFRTARAQCPIVSFPGPTLNTTQATSAG